MTSVLLSIIIIILTTVSHLSYELLLSLVFVFSLVLLLFYYSVLIIGPSIQEVPALFDSIQLLFQQNSVSIALTTTESVILNQYQLFNSVTEWC
jgi:hypothetical protein